jgi:hypothetical protein
LILPVLTINGKAELVVHDAAAYQALLDRVEAIEGTQEGKGRPYQTGAAGLRSAAPQAWHSRVLIPILSGVVPICRLPTRSLRNMPQTRSGETRLSKSEQPRPDRTICRSWAQSD